MEGDRMMEKEIEIDVRALTGESIKVSISLNKTVKELKLLLTRSFPPASSASSFHLFFKGAKLSLENQLCSLANGNNDFLVLIPFTRKEEPQTQNSNIHEVHNDCPISSFADSVYSELIQDASLLSEATNSCDLQQLHELDNSSVGYKRKQDFDSCNADDKDGGLHCLLWDLLQPTEKNFVDEKNCRKLLEVLEENNCLTNPKSATCLLLEVGTLCDLGVCKESAASCSCPAWLKQIMEAFIFLNSFSTVLQFHQQDVTSGYLKMVLDQLHEFGSRTDFEHIRHLSALSPKVVCFMNVGTAIVNCPDAIVIFDTEKRKSKIDAKNGKKLISLSKAFLVMKKRESMFKISLGKGFKRLMAESGNVKGTFISLENLLKFVKLDDISMSKIRTRQSLASRPCSLGTHCHETHQLMAVEMVQHLQKGIGSRGQIVHVENICARNAVYAELHADLSHDTEAALKCIGVSKLYTHQAESITASLDGKDVVVATMTSSGKSLCYNIPVLEVLSRNLSSCAIFLFPTKALAQDQFRVLLSMVQGCTNSINIEIYDGDTAQQDRAWFRANARLLITNPDMLHMSILPCHKQFSRILSNLRFVVIDEAHAYKGAFGCHTALILRRLRRLCSHVYGSDPSFIFCTATSANPSEHCRELANLSSLELIENDGSPSSMKLFVLWNPAVSNASVSDVGSDYVHKSKSPILEVSCLFAEMIQHGLRCIAFCRSRKLTELVLFYTQEILQETAPHLVDSVCAYRGGYIAKDRRNIERDFFSGKLCGIAATNALELGVDVGHIDATLHLGFPGSVASLWQQAGRSGRRTRPSLAIYVAFDGPLDQYFMKFPKKLFNSPIECCHIDAQNPQVLEQHLACAALEHPLCLLYDEKYFGSCLSKTLESLRKKGVLAFDSFCESLTRRWNYIGIEKSPCRGINIRAIEAVRYKVIDMQRKEALEEIEESRAFFQVYEGAVYMHQGKTYLVKELDISEKVALCCMANLQYYTKTRDYTDVHVNGSDIVYQTRVSEKQSSRTTAQAHPCRVTTTWFGFYRIQRKSNKILDAFDLSLPKYTYESQAVWIRVAESIKGLVEEKLYSFRGGLHAASHAIHNVVPLHVRCSPSELAPECPNPHDSRSFPHRILLYDQLPGGTGVSLQIQPFFPRLLQSALELLSNCCCSTYLGCPNCVQSLVCHEYNEVIHKDAAIMIMKGVLDAEETYFR